MNVYLETKDYYNTQEDFQLLYDEENEMLITHPVPENLSGYYNSKAYISHNDSKKHIIDKIYHFIKNHSLKSKYKLIHSLNTPKNKLLDIGAGTGDFIKKMSLNNWNAFGVEPNISARHLASQKGITLNSDLKNITDTDFDIVTLWHVLEHLPNLDNQIKTIVNKLDDRGYLIVAVPNYKSYDAQKYKGYWAAYDTPRHLWHFSKKSIRTIFYKYDLEVIDIKPMYFDSFYVSLLSEKYKHKKNRYIQAFLTGLLSNLMAIKNGEYSSLIYILKKK